MAAKYTAGIHYLTVSSGLRSKVTVPVGCLGQCPLVFACMLPPPGHTVSVHSARTVPLPAPAEHPASTATGPHCCRLEEQREVERMRGNAVEGEEEEEEEQEMGREGGRIN